jgi:hypothetical protein
MDFGNPSPTEHVEQTVTFNDASAAFQDSRGTVMDSFRSDDMIQDVRLSDWFSRPIKIYNADWAVGSQFTAHFDPWTLFWEDSENLKRVSNYRMLQCTLKVKVVINGNAFYYGRAMMFYDPLHTRNDFRYERDLVAQDFVVASQKPHVFINPTLSQGGTLELPFFYPRNALDIVEKEWTEMGKITIASKQALKHANGSTNPITISVFAWAENVKISIPTHHTPSPSEMLSPNDKLRARFMAESDEYASGPISKPAMTVARVAGSLSEIPFIGKFARATEVGAKVLSRVSSLFGFSAPTIIDKDVTVLCAKNNYANTNCPSDNAKLSVDIKQEVSIDPTILGLPPQDEMTIQSIACRESLVFSFPWRTDYIEEQLIYNTYVDPCITRTYGDEIHMSATCVAALPFRYWRGTLRFRFQVVSSEHHKGRLKMVYDPYAGAGSSPYNTVYTHIHDIAESKDFTIDVGWGQTDMFVEHLPPSSFTTDAASMSATAALPHITTSNGVLSVYVLNKLTVPNSTLSDSHIAVNVFVSALDDFQVAQPSDDIVKFRTSPMSLAAKFQPEAGHMDDATEEGIVTDPTTLTTFASPAGDSPKIDLLFFGETIASFRQLFKRFAFSELIYGEADVGSWLLRITRTAFPMFGGYWPDEGGTSQIDVGTVLPYTYSATNLFTFLGPCYGGWRGSIRWSVDTTSVETDYGNQRSCHHVARSDEGVNSASSLSLPTGLIATISYLNLVYQLNSFSGMTRWTELVNPIHTFEVPFYTNLRFLSPRKHTVHAITGTPGVPSFTYVMEHPGGNMRVPLHVGAGEDFQLYFWLGPPRYYYEDALPDL